ncbi:unnamed protein product, partial [marine sediment metagenome]
ALQAAVEIRRLREENERLQRANEICESCNHAGWWKCGECGETRTEEDE